MAPNAREKTETISGAANTADQHGMIKLSEPIRLANFGNIFAGDEQHSLHGDNDQQRAVTSEITKMLNALYSDHSHHNQAKIELLRFVNTDEFTNLVDAKNHSAIASRLTELEQSGKVSNNIADTKGNSERLLKIGKTIAQYSKSNLAGLPPKELLGYRLDNRLAKPLPSAVGEQNPPTDADGRIRQDAITSTKIVNDFADSFFPKSSYFNETRQSFLEAIADSSTTMENWLKIENLNESKHENNERDGQPREWLPNSEHYRRQEALAKINAPLNVAREQLRSVPQTKLCDVDTAIRLKEQITLHQLADDRSTPEQTFGRVIKAVQTKNRSLAKEQTKVVSALDNIIPPKKIKGESTNLKERLKFAREVSATREFWVNPSGANDDLKMRVGQFIKENKKIFASHENAGHVGRLAMALTNYHGEHNGDNYKKSPWTAEQKLTNSASGLRQFISETVGQPLIRKSSIGDKAEGGTQGQLRRMADRPGQQRLSFTKQDRPTTSPIDFDGPISTSVRNPTGKIHRNVPNGTVRKAKRHKGKLGFTANDPKQSKLNFLPSGEAAKSTPTKAKKEQVSTQGDTSASTISESAPTDSNDLPKEPSTTDSLAKLDVRNRSNYGR